MDFCISVCVPFCISVFIHFCWDLSESVGNIRMESVAGVWAGITKPKKKRLIASEVTRCFLLFFLLFLYQEKCQL